MTGVQTCALPICFPVTIGGINHIQADADQRLGARFVRAASFDAFQYTVLQVWVRFTGTSVDSNRMEFLTINGFRQFRPSSEGVEREAEIRLVDEFIERLRTTTLNGVIV